MGAAYELSATVREKVGKGAARSVRRQGMTPAVIYGGNKPPIAISLPARELSLKILAGGFYTSVATIEVGEEKIQALPRDYQLDPVSDKPLHIDFLRVTPDSTITIDVPVQFINESQAPGVKRGGAVNVVRHRISLICRVDNIPERIVADLTGLDINDSLHISAITLPEGVRPAIKRDFTIATIAAPAGVKEELRAAAEAAAKAAETAAEAPEGAEASPAAGTAPAAPGSAPAAAAKPAAAKPEAAKK